MTDQPVTVANARPATMDLLLRIAMYDPEIDGPDKLAMMQAEIRSIMEIMRGSVPVVTMPDIATLERRINAYRGKKPMTYAEQLLVNDVLPLIQWVNIFVNDTVTLEEMAIRARRLTLNEAIRAIDVFAQNAKDGDFRVACILLRSVIVGIDAVAEHWTAESALKDLRIDQLNARIQMVDLPKQLEDARRWQRMQEQHGCKCDPPGSSEEYCSGHCYKEAEAQAGRWLLRHVTEMLSLYSGDITVIEDMIAAGFDLEAVAWGDDVSDKDPAVWHARKQHALLSVQKAMRQYLPMCQTGKQPKDLDEDVLKYLPYDESDESDEWAETT